MKTNHAVGHPEAEVTYCGLRVEELIDLPDVRVLHALQFPNTEGAVISDDLWCAECSEEVMEERNPPEAVWSGPGDISDVAIEGRCVIVDKYREYWARHRDGKNYRSAVMTDPTWEDLMVVANEVIRTTGDWHHVFLETIEEVKDPGLQQLADAFDEEPYKVYRLGLGS